MPMELRTGLPGTFKSCGAVEQLIKYAGDDAYKDRPRFALGVTGLRPDLAEPITASQFRDWTSFPAGSIILVDEAQKVMPARRTGEPPKFIRDMSEHRHRGIEFIFITQNASMVDKYVRDLVDRHYHHVRKYGSMWAERWEYQQCESDPTRKGVKALAMGKEFVKASPEAMEAYTSAELHTIKRKLPRFIKIAAVVAIAIPVLFFVAYRQMQSASQKQVDSLTGGKSQAKGVTSVGDRPTLFGEQGGSKSTAGKDKEPVMTKAEWVARFEPRVSGMPWSAPAYDSLPVQGVPDLYCISMEIEGTNDSTCHCITEQGTSAVVPHNMCMQMARGGTYNPYRTPRPDQVAGGVREQPVASQEDRAALGVGAEPVRQSPRRLAATGGGTGPMGGGYVPMERTKVGSVD